MDKIDEVLTRGVKEIIPDKNSLKKLMKKRKIRLYLGIDPTGALLTLGHSVVLRKLQQFADLGHEVILLIGNGTVKIGDPSGRDATRPVLTDGEIEENFKNWKDQADKVLDFTKIKVKRNGDWLDKLTMPEIIKLAAKTTIQQLIERDMFQERMKKGLPIFTHEILYPLLQGYDSVVMDVDLEVGGTDQTFNMMMGRTLQKIYHNKEKWVLSTPIINGLDGRKMSKSYHNYVALTENPNDMYGKLMKIDDQMIIDYFTLLTDTSLTEINKMKKDLKSGVNPMELKKRLALTITSFYHSPQEAKVAEKNFEKVVQEKGIPDEIKECLVKPDNHHRLGIVDLLMQCHLVASKSEAKRLIEQKAVTVGQEIISDWHQEVKITEGIIVRVGKRNYVRVKLT